MDKFVIECKVLHKSLERTVSEGLKQTAGYMDRCGSEEGHLVIFDRSEGKRREDKIFRRARGTYRRPHHHRVEDVTARASDPRITIRWSPRLFDKGIRRDSEPLRQRRYLTKVEQPLAAKHVRHDALSTDLR